MRVPLSYFGRTSGLLAVVVVSGSALATADGPDHFRLRAPAALRAEPRSDAAVVRHLPDGGVCLRNLGCRAAPRSSGEPWCRIEHAGQQGWVEARRLAEAACAQGVPPVIRGRLRGYEDVDYPLHGRAGQTLTVVLRARHPQLYFNVLPPGGEAAMFIGSQTGDRFARTLPADGIYTVRVYLMRAAARRNERGAFTLRLGLVGTPLAARDDAKDARVEGTPYHATALLRCARGDAAPAPRCEAGVIRRGVDGTATVVVRWPAGDGGSPLRQVLFVKGRAVDSDAPDPLQATREGDLTRLRIGDDERIEVPDALLTGG